MTEAAVAIVWTRVRPAAEVDVAIPVPGAPDLMPGYELQETFELGEGFSRGPVGLYEETSHPAWSNSAVAAIDLPQRLLQRQDLTWSARDLPVLASAAKRILIAHRFPVLAAGRPEHAWRWDGADLYWSQSVPGSIDGLAADVVLSTDAARALWPDGSPLRWAAKVAPLVRRIEEADWMVVCSTVSAPKRREWLDFGADARSELWEFLNKDSLRRAHDEFLIKSERIRKRQQEASGVGPKRKAERWKMPALKVAQETRMAKRSYSQERIAEAIEEANISGLPGRETIVKAIQAWERDGLLQPSLYKASRQDCEPRHLESPTRLP